MWSISELHNWFSLQRKTVLLLINNKFEGSEILMIFVTFECRDTFTSWDASLHNDVKNEYAVFV